MSTPKTKLWKIEPHTQAKHEILRRYLGAWFGIMGKYNPKIIYIDGFSGAGKYIDGENGSPIIALNICKEHHTKQNIQKVTFVFIEERQDRVEFLETEINKMNLPSCFEILTIHDEFENTLESILNSLEIDGKKMAPTFAFIDPFGYKGIPFTIIERLLQNEKTEVFINLMADSMNRWIDHPDTSITNHITSLLGTNECLEDIKNSSNRLHEIRNIYQKQLLKNAKFVRYFEMRDKQDRPIYYLFFAGNNRLGHIKMKDSFWKVDTATGFKFSDATNQKQLVLFENDNNFAVAEIILNQFANQKVSCRKIRVYIEDNTPFIVTQMRSALKYLEVNNKICVDPCKEDGKIRRKSSFPDEAIINFNVP